MYLPDTEYAAFSASMTSAGWDCSEAYCFSLKDDCATLAAKMGNLTVTIDSTEYSIPPLGYILTPP